MDDRSGTSGGRDRVLSRQRSLPEGVELTDVQEVAVELGLADPAVEGAGAD